MTDGEADDLVPARGRGRPVRSIEGGLETLPGARVDTPRCGVCEKWSPKLQWCPLRASPNNGRGPMCRYGLVLFRARKLRERREVK